MSRRKSGSARTSKRYPVTRRWTTFRALETANQDNQVVLDPLSLVVDVLQGANEARTSAQCPRYTPSVAWPSMSDDDERQ